MATFNDARQGVWRNSPQGAVVWIALAMLAMAVSACRAQRSPAAAAETRDSAGQETPGGSRDVTIGLLLSSLYDPVYVALQNGAIESASRLHVDLLVREASDDADEQLQQIAELLTLGVDAVVLNPVDSAAIRAGVQQVQAAALPIVTVERRVQGATVSAHVASDNIAGGEMAAAYLAEVLRGSGNVVELAGIPGTSAAQDRGAGFDRVMRTYPEISIVSREVANFDRREARRVFASILAQHPDLDGVFAHNDEMILGAIEAAQEAGRAEEIVFVGFDATKDAIAAMESGLLRATIAQQPMEMGRLAVELAYDGVQGSAIPESVAVDLALVTQ